MERPKIWRLVSRSWMRIEKLLTKMCSISMIVMRISSLLSRLLSSARSLMKPTWLTLQERGGGWTGWWQDTRKPRLPRTSRRSRLMNFETVAKCGEVRERDSGLV
ncbi:unnamed protein product [Prunus brigantina]